MPKRANAEGTVRQRPNGSWEARVSYLDDGGTRKRLSVYGASDAEVRTKLREALRRIDDALPPRDASETVAAWIDAWVATILRASKRKDTTKALYRTVARTHLQRAPFGTLRLNEVRPRHIDALMLRLSDSGLSDSTRRTVYTVCRDVLEGAVRDALLASNPAVKVKRPSVEHREARFLEPDVVHALLDAATSSRHRDVLHLIAGTGLRRGEALAVRWRDVDTEKGLLRVRQTVARVNGALRFTPPKSARSRRDIPLTPNMLRLLARHRTAQLEERLRAGTAWTDTGLVFTTETGTAVDPRNLLRAFTGIARRAGPDGVGLHTLRHSAATTLLEAGVNIVAVSRLMGHSSVAITGDLYGHATDQGQRDAMAKLDEAIGG